MNKYRIISEIGKGAFCTVFKGYDLLNHRFVAIKKYIYSINDIKEKIIAEVETLKNSNHPNIIKLFETVIENNEIFLIFELQYCTLIEEYKQIKRKGRRLSQETIKSYIYQVALSLDFLHSRGLMHRDIKPENVMIKRGSKLIKLIDFGFCKRTNLKNHTDYISTRWYRAPQLVLGTTYNCAVDVFALACLMLELYNGIQVFRGETSIDQIFKICQYLGNIKDWRQGSNKLKTLGIQMKFMPKRLHRLTTDISKYGIDLLQQMLIFDPNKRSSIKSVLSHRYFNDVIVPFEVNDYLKIVQSQNFIGKLSNSPSQNKISLTKHRRMITQIQQNPKLKPQQIVIPPLQIPSLLSIPSVSPLRSLPHVPHLGLRTLTRYDSNHQLIHTDRSSVQRKSVHKQLLTSRQHKYFQVTPRRMMLF